MINRANMELDSDDLNIAPNLHFTNKSTMTLASKVLKYASLCVENMNTDMVDVLMTTLWICVRTRRSKEMHDDDQSSHGKQEVNKLTDREAVLEVKDSKDEASKDKKPCQEVTPSIESVCTSNKDVTETSIISNISVDTGTIDPFSETSENINQSENSFNVSKKVIDIDRGSNQPDLSVQTIVRNPEDSRLIDRKEEYTNNSDDENSFTGKKSQFLTDDNCPHNFNTHTQQSNTAKCHCRLGDSLSGTSPLKVDRGTDTCYLVEAVSIGIEAVGDLQCDIECKKTVNMESQQNEIDSDSKNSSVCEASVLKSPSVSGKIDMISEDSQEPESDAFANLKTFVEDVAAEKCWKTRCANKRAKRIKAITSSNITWKEEPYKYQESGYDDDEQDDDDDLALMPSPVMLMSNIHYKHKSEKRIPDSGFDLDTLEQQQHEQEEQLSQLEEGYLKQEELSDDQLMKQQQMHHEHVLKVQLKTAATLATTSVSAGVLKDLLPNPNREKTLEKIACVQSANKEVMSLLTQPLSGKRKRGPYIQYNSAERAQIGKWACEYGTATTARLFAQEFGKTVHESTVRSIKKQYLIQCQKTDEKVDSLEKHVGRPKLLGEFDSDVVEYVQKLRTSGAIVNRKIVIAGATGIIKNKASHLLKENGGHIVLDNSWAESLLRRVGYRRKSIAKLPSVLPEDFEVIQQQFLSDIHNMIDSLQIPDELVFNLHQTKINIIPCGNWVAEPSSSRHIELKKLDDKRKVTAILTSSMAGDLLPVQVLYLGKTDQCHARVTVPDEWDVWHSENQCSNDETLSRYAEKILIPYVNNMRGQLDVYKKHPAFLLIDAFSGPKSESFLQTLLLADIHVKVVPGGCASKLEPLNICGNSQIKEEIKSQFINWYADQVLEEIEGSKEMGFIPSELKLTWMKPIHADWMFNAWTKVKDSPEIVTAGWLQSGIKRVKAELY